jgi:hypothetical protein
VTLLLTATAASAQTPSASPPLTIRFAEREVAVSGATAGGKVAWFSVAKEIRNFALMQRRDAITEANAAGEAAFVLDEAVPPVSIWVAVDVATGQFAVAAPSTFEPRELVLAADALQPGRHGSDDEITDNHEFLEMALVRPSKGSGTLAGAWGGTVGDGGQSDDSAKPDAKVALPLSRLRPIGQSAELRPPVLTPGDVLAVIDPIEMAVTVTTVAPGARP